MPGQHQPIGNEKRLINLYHKHRSITIVAQILGCGVTTVRHRLMRAKEPRVYSRGPRPHTVKLNSSLVVACCKKSFSMKQAGVKLGIGEKTVRAYLDRLDLSPGSILKAKPKKKNPRVVCACGCGEMIRKYDPDGYERKYAHGHNGRKECPTSRCIGCGVAFTQKRPSSTAQYCSHACYSEHIPKRGRHPTCCIDCGAEIGCGRKRCRACWTRYANENSKRCMDCGNHIKSSQKRCGACWEKFKKTSILVFPGRGGEKHWNWQGGTSFDPYPLEWTKTLRKSIRQRDGYMCQVCGKSQKKNGRSLPVHHIDYDKENLDPKNLISLCASCHGATNTSKQKSRRHWIQFLQKKMKGVA